MTETWKAIPGWEGFYEASDMGRVRSLTRYVLHRKFGPSHLSRYEGRVLRPTKSTGYPLVQLVETGRGRHEYRYVHDLVLLTFVGPKPSDKEVCHGPEGGHVNCLSNLRYDTRLENARDKKRHRRR